MRREAQVQAVQDMAERHAQVAVNFQNKAVQRLLQVHAQELSPDQALRWFLEAAKLAFIEAAIAM